VRVRGMHAAIERDGVEDVVAVEEPLEIRVDGRPLAVTMRTPGDDEHLVAGFLYGEGLLDRWPRIGPTADLAANAIEVAGPLRRDPGERRFYTTSSCGVCGKGAIEQVAARSFDRAALAARARERYGMEAIARTWDEIYAAL